MKYMYAAEKFSSARRCLMLPHPKGEADSIMAAFHECSLGLKNIDKTGVPSDVFYQIEKLEKFLDTDDIKDPEGKGKWLIKAKTLSIDEKIEISRLVDELAYFFNQ